ncbi:primosomal protein N' [Thermoproteota archaeon]
MKSSLLVAKIAVALPIDRLFDYSIPKSLQKKIEVGMRVKVFFHFRKISGYVIKISHGSKIKKLNPIIELLDSDSMLSPQDLQLARKIQNYYVCSLGEAIESMLPRVIKYAKDLDLSSKKREKEIAKDGGLFYIKGGFNPSLLQYLEVKLLEYRQAKKTALIVLPEIQNIEEVSDYFSKNKDLRIGVWHGKLPQKTMVNLWIGVASGKIDLVIGARASIFAPLPNLGLIVVIDEGNFAHKDDQVPYYNAMQIALFRCAIQGCDVFLSSLIPSSRLFHEMLRENLPIKELGVSKPIEIQYPGMNFKDKLGLMAEREIANSLEKKQKILIFQNRKGFATFVYCKKCKNTLQCNQCSSNLRYDHVKKRLICYHCNKTSDSSEICPKCNASYVKFGGLGIEKLESNLKRIFPSASIVTMDELLKNRQKSANFDIVVATQKILGYHELNFDTLIIWDLDSLLNIGDFQAAEKTYRILASLIAMTSKKMLICAGISDSFYLLKALKNLDYNSFYETEFKTRKELKLPPFYHIGLVTIRGKNRERIDSAANQIHDFIKMHGKKTILVSDACDTLQSKLRGKHYRYLMAKARSASSISSFFKKNKKELKFSNVIVTVNIDPV